MFNKVMEDFEKEINETQISVPAETIKTIAKQLGMVDIEEDERVLAALDDYFKTLNDGQYSPMSGEHNNASNNTEVYAIAKKHGVDPSHLMKFLSDVAMFDKFQKLAISEAIAIKEFDIVDPKTKSKIKDRFRAAMGGAKYKNHIDAAIKAFNHELDAGRPAPEIVSSISSAYDIPAEILQKELGRIDAEEPARKYKAVGMEEGGNYVTNEEPPEEEIIKPKGLKRFTESYEKEIMEGKQRSVYEAHLMRFLSDTGVKHEQGCDCVYVDDSVMSTMMSKFPEFKGMVKPLSEFKSDVYVTMDDGPKEIYKGTKGVG